MHELVSVSIPTYRRSEWLRRAIASVFAQTYPHWELFIVDDNGEPEFSDATRAAIADYLADARVHYLAHGVNKGVTAARNTGLEAARGEFIAFLDDDDEWAPEKLAKQLAVFAEGGDKLGMVYSGWWAIDRRTGETRVMTPRLRGSIHDKLGINHIGPPSHVLCRTSALRGIGGFDASFRAREDIEMYFRLSKDYAIDFVAEPLMKYYIHAGGISQGNPHKVRGYHKFLEKHGDDLRGRHKVLGEIYEALAETHVRQGQRLPALQSLAKSYAHDPTRLKRVAKIGLLFLGEDVFRSAKRRVADAKRHYRQRVKARTNLGAS